VSEGETPRRAPYPATGPWAVLARCGLVLAVAAVAYASLAPGRYVPRLLYSYHLEHFAAFYVVALTGSAALPRARLRWLGAASVVLALAMELPHLLFGGAPQAVYQNGLADVGGAFAALLPMAVDRFRRRLNGRS
jgi:hypothetical protein